MIQDLRLGARKLQTGSRVNAWGYKLRWRRTLRRSRRPTLPAAAASRRSAKLALPGSPHGVEASSALARRELAKLVVGLLGEFEDVLGDGHGVVVVVKDGEKVVRVDAGAWRVRDAEGAAAVARWGKGVDVEVTLALVVWSRRCKDLKKKKKKGERTSAKAERALTDLGRP